MKLSVDLKSPTKPAWIEAVLADFPSFLQDHADCERKASAMAMSMVAKYPDRTEILEELIDTGIEELEHFKMVYDIMAKKGIPLAHSIPEDIYIKKLIKSCHSGILERFLDRLLIGSIVETRGAERFKIVADHMEDSDLAKFYKMLWTSEAKHGHIYVKMALSYFPEDKVYDRLHYWRDLESEILNELPFRAALH